MQLAIFLICGDVKYSRTQAFHRVVLLCSQDCSISKAPRPLLLHPTQRLLTYHELSCLRLQLSLSLARLYISSPPK